MEPIPETVEVIRSYGPFVVEDEDLLEELRTQAALVVEVVPECVGFSLASYVDDVAFTLAATSLEISVLDAVQYLDGGPCVGAVREERVIQYEPVLGEERWHLFARATAALAVASTLTFPIVVDGGVVGSVNLYASAPTAFTDHHEELAEILGAWAPGAVTNADLSFSTRSTAEQAPSRVRAELDITIAIGMIATRDAVDLLAAHDRLTLAAQRAGVTEAALAMTMIELARGQDGS